MTSLPLTALEFPRAIEIDPQTDPRWEAFLVRHADATIYHHPAWLKVLELEYGRKTLNLACEESGGTLCGILPLLSTRGIPFRARHYLRGRRLSSLPRTPVAGPIAKNREAMSCLLKAAIERAQRERDTRLELKLADEISAPIEGLTIVPWRLSYVLSLPSNPGELRLGNSRNHGRIKWKVRTATKLGLSVRRAETEDDLLSWYPLYLKTMRHHGVPPRAYRFFKALWEHLRPRGLMQLFLAEHNSPARVVAGSIYLSFGSTVFYAFNGVARKDLRLHPNDLIQWHAIRDASNRGFSKYDFGEVCAGQEGLADFKTGWGGVPVRLYRTYYPQVQTAEPNDGSSGALARIALALWRAMPLSATALAGNLVNAYL